MEVNKKGEINFKISEKLLPGFSNVQEKRFVSIIGLAKSDFILKNFSPTTHNLLAKKSNIAYIRIVRQLTTALEAV